MTELGLDSDKIPASELNFVERKSNHGKVVLKRNNLDGFAFLMFYKWEQL